MRGQLPWWEPSGVVRGDCATATTARAGAPLPLPAPFGFALDTADLFA
ncbi:hypothetical protein ACWEPB_17655 [Kitasatospora cineracea]